MSQNVISAQSWTASSRILASSIVSIVVLIGALPAASAQVTGAAGDLPPPRIPSDTAASPTADSETLHDPAAVGVCICGSQKVAELNRRMMAAKQGYDDGQARLQQTQAALDQARSRVDVNNIDQVNAFRRLSLEHEEVSSKFYSETLPAYSKIIQQYNDAVAQYNRSCSGRGLDPLVVATVQANLICRTSELP